MQFIDETEADLSRLVDSDFGSPKVGEDLRRRALNWLLYKARCVPALRRAVRFAPKVALQQAHLRAVGVIADSLREGRDVSPWLSPRIRKRPNDVKADVLFNDWQISHFHLRTLFRDQQNTFKSEALLFAYITASEAVLLNILPHGRSTWTELELLKSLRAAAPEVMDSFRFRGVVSSPNDSSPNDIALAREKGMNVTIVMDGQSYMAPGMGLTASRHPLRIVRASDVVERALRQLRQQISANDTSNPAVRQLTWQVGVPVRLGKRFEAGRLIIFEKNRRIDLFTGPCVC